MGLMKRHITFSKLSAQAFATRLALTTDQPLATEGRAGI